MKLYGGRIDEIALNEDDVRSYGGKAGVEIHVPFLLFVEHLLHEGTRNLKDGLGVLHDCLVPSFLDELVLHLLLRKLSQDSCQDLFHRRGNSLAD